MSDEQYTVQFSVSRPWSQLSRWAVLAGMLIVLPVAYLAVSAALGDASRVQQNESYRQARENLEFELLAHAELVQATLETRALVARELAPNVLRIVDGSHEAAHRNWGITPYTPEVVAAANQCISGETDPRRVRCQVGDRWMTGADATVILSELGDGRAVITEAEAAEMLAVWQTLEQQLAFTQRAVVQTRNTLRTLDAEIIDTTGPRWVWIGGMAISMMGTAFCVWLGLACLVLLKINPISVEVKQTGVRLDGRWIPAHEILSCEVVGRSVVLTLRDGRVRITPGVFASHGPASVERVLQKIVLVAEERVDEEQSRERVNQQQRALAAELRSAGLGGPHE